jgi:hypothetical protein
VSHHVYGIDHPQLSSLVRGGQRALAALLVAAILSISALADDGTSINGVVEPLRVPALESNAQAPVGGTPVDPDLQRSAEPMLVTVLGQRAQTPIDVDGRLNEETWLSIVPTGGFIQRDPEEGAAASEHTELRVAYDAQALYLGLRLFDTEPEKIVRRLSRRDRAEGDSVTVYLDPRHDGLTGVVLQVSAAGVQRDAAIFNDFETDDAWDAVWASAVTRDERGWNAEIRIPFSQLRFASGPAPTWGLNVERFVHRKNESAWLQLVRKDERRLASKMVRLGGLQNIQSRTHLELLPYVASRSELIAPKAGNPFNDGSRYFGAAGLDLKWALSSRFAIDATFNPDFGQVEVDPSVVNLTEFETEFEEKRPFFVEGSQIFTNFGRSGSGSALLDDDMFYSRRIGREPQGSADGDFIDTPAATMILGAAKLTGKTASGWSLGVLEAVTSAERARIWRGDQRSTDAIEPLTNYFVGRMFKEGKRAGSGLIATAVNRAMDTDSSLASLLPKQSYVAGYDGYFFFDSDRRWVLSGLAAGSRVSGSEAAIRRLQMSSRRYFQRPDANYVHLDENATSLSGWASGISLKRQGGNLQFSTNAAATSPAFEVNDLGFQSRADQIETSADVTWSKYDPDWFTRERWVSVGKSTRWNFGGSKQSDSWSAQTSLTFMNYWYADAGYVINRESDDDHLTRGGPLARRPQLQSFEAELGTDSRERVWINAGASRAWDSSGGWEASTYLSIFYRPSERVRLSTVPYYYRANDVAQIVDSVSDPLATGTLGTRYIFAGLEQTQLSMTTRADLSLTPNVSFQLYVEPFIGVGRYSAFKELTTLKSFSFFDYQRDGGSVAFDPDSGSYVIDPDGAGPANSFNLFNENFNYKSLVAKAVLRWEWKPGSTLYAAWTQDRFDDAYAGDFRLGRDARALFRAPADDVFVLKISYWFGR